MSARFETEDEAISSAIDDAVVAGAVSGLRETTTAMLDDLIEETAIRISAGAVTGLRAETIAVLDGLIEETAIRIAAAARPEPHPKSLRHWLRRRLRRAADG